MEAYKGYFIDGSALMTIRSAPIGMWRYRRIRKPDD
jgi:hypothetical protein